jgi:hypothetical protein
MEGLHLPCFTTAACRSFLTYQEIYRICENTKKFLAAVLILGSEDKFLGVCELGWENYSTVFSLIFN